MKLTLKNNDEKKINQAFAEFEKKAYHIDGPFFAMIFKRGNGDSGNKAIL